MIDRADRDARAAEIGILEQRLRTLRHRKRITQRLARLAEELQEGTRPVAAYLEAAKHLYRHRLPMVWDLANQVK